MQQKRYLFLERSGLYKHPSAKDLGSTKAAEPPIGDIATESTDQEFVDKATDGRLTIEEFQAFTSTLLEDEVTEYGRKDREAEELLEEERMANEEGYHDSPVGEDLNEFHLDSHARVRPTRQKWHAIDT